MAGFAYDQSPIPDATLNFDLPDSDSYLFSVGARFKINSHMDLGAALLYDMKSSRTVSNLNSGRDVFGTFTDASALLAMVGMSYKF